MIVTEPMSERNSAPILLTVTQAAERLAVRPSTIRSWLGKGILPKTKCGRCTRVAASAVEAFISDNTTRSSHSRASRQSAPSDPSTSEPCPDPNLHDGEHGG
jgi:excisionase family DNA binding protein